MAAISNDKEEVYMWIRKVIESCTTYHHYLRVYALISNFYQMYNDLELSQILKDYACHREIQRCEL